MKRVHVAELADIATRTMDDDRVTIDVELVDGGWIQRKRRDEAAQTMPRWVIKWMEQNAED